MREAGVPVKRIAKHLGRQNSSLRRFIADAGGKRPSARERSELRLSLEEREEISRGLAAGYSIRAIAEALGRSPRRCAGRSTPTAGGRSIGRWWPIVRPAGGRCDQSGPSWRSAAGFAGWSSASSRPSGRPSRSRRGWLWSTPIARRCRCPTRPSTSHSSSKAVERCAKSCTRACAAGRAMRRAKAYTKGNVGQGQLRNMVMISERPAEVKDRAVPGHWEGDLIFGKKMTSIGTLVERHSRYVILLKLPNGHGAEAVRKAMTKRILTLPAQLRRSITWDQGKEMAEHVRFTVETGVQIYFCDPKSPWQRGSNENTNGLLRQYLPKASDLRSAHSGSSTPSPARSTRGLDRRSAG